MQKTFVSVFVCGLLLASISVLGQKRKVSTPSLRGSLASVILMDRQATLHDFTRLRTADEVEKFADLDYLVPLTGNSNYQLDGVSYPVVRPAVKLFVERISSQFRSVCSRKLTVTSATRPRAEQPRNASKRSVHPTGMAIDFRIPDSLGCIAWLQKTLLTLEGKKVLEATRERTPPHFHVAVFPKPYMAYVATNTASKKKKK